MLCACPKHSEQNDNILAVPKKMFFLKVKIKLWNLNIVPNSRTTPQLICTCECVSVECEKYYISRTSYQNY